MTIPSLSKPIRSKPSTPVSTFPYNKNGRSRGTPLVQRLQSTPDYIDVYTGSLLGDLTSDISPPTRSSTMTRMDPPAFRLVQRSTISTAHSEPCVDLEQETGPDPSTTTQATAPPARWTGGPGFGVKHINDPMTFSLWDPISSKFRSATRKEGNEIIDKFYAKSVGFFGYLMIVEVANPPKPVPLTVACMPAVFTPIGQGKDARPDILGDRPYVNPRGEDLCPGLGIKRYVSPTHIQKVTVLQALSKLMSFNRVTFLPTSIRVELIADDGRKYDNRSLPPYASGLNLVYYHSQIPYYKSVQKYARQRLIDPASYLEALGNVFLPQDTTNYLQEANGGMLSPGIRISTGPPSGQGTYANADANASQSSTCGVFVKRGTKLLVTASHHNFLVDTAVYHPSDKGEKIGEVVDRYPERDIALIELTPAHTGRFSNKTYFQAEPPSRLAEESELALGSWFEVEAMSTGLISFMYQGTALLEPPRPPGGPRVPFHHWKRDPVFRIFGAMSSDMSLGMCGAPMVEERTGKVAGFFRLAGGDEAICAGVDDLIAEGIEIA